MMNHMVNEPEITVHEVIPGAGILPQAAVDQLTVDLAEGHGRSSSPMGEREDGARKGRPDHGAGAALQSLAYPF
jgi:hypothetical protein